MSTPPCLIDKYAMAARGWLLMLMLLPAVSVQAAADKAGARVLDLAEHYQNEIKQREIDELNRRNEEQQAEINQYSQRQRWLWTMAGGSWIMLAGSLYFQLRQRRSYHSLQLLNDQLVQAKNKLQATMEAIPDLMFEVDRDGRYYDCHSPRPELQIGFREAFLGRTASELMPTEAAATCLEALREAGQTGYSQGKQLVLPLADGERWFELSVAAKPAIAGEGSHFIVMSRDITAQKAAESELKESERGYREIFENVTDLLSLVEVTPEGRFCNLAFNFAYEQSMGVDRKDLIGLDVGSVMAEDGDNLDLGESLVAKYRRCVKAGSTLEEELFLDLPIGRRHFHSTLVPLYDESGRIYRILGIANDVTELKRAEREFRMLAENAPDNICRYDRQGRMTYMNPHLEVTLGVKQRQALGLTTLELFPDGRYADYHAKVVGVAATGQADEIEVELTDIGEGVRHHHIRFVAERETSGEIVGVLAIGRDISEFRRATEQIQALNLSLEQRVLERTSELRQQTLYLRTIIDTLPLSVWLKDTESRFMMVNQAAATSCRLSIEQMVGKSDFDLWPREQAESHVAEDREVMATRQRKIVEESLAGREDAVWIEIDKVPVIDEDGSVLGTVGVARNISERKALDVAREKALAEAVRLVRVRSEFIARMSHELRTPLNGILGYAQVLLRDNRLDERQASMLAVIQRSGEHLLGLINDILDFAKFEAGKQSLNLGRLALADFLSNLAGIVSVRAEQKQLAFRYEIADDVPSVIRADEIRLRQVLLNLLANAVKFSERGGIRLRVFIAAPGKVCFEVEDSGIGIAEQQLENIFQPFEQAADRKWNAGGTGLGLAISRELVRLMGGELRVASHLGEGSRFWFELDTGLEGNELESAARLRAPRRALVTDASVARRAMLVTALSRLGIEVVEARDGGECFARARLDVPVLIVLGSAFAGGEMIRDLRRLPTLAETPIIVIADSVDDSQVYQGDDAVTGITVLRTNDASEFMRQAARLLDIDRLDSASNSVMVGGDSFELPPAGEMQILHRLALEGNMRDILLRTAHLIELDERYRPFAEQIGSLARSYQSKALLELVERNLENQKTSP